MVFYLEAYESGSIFENLLPNGINVYANTASNSTSHSYACYYDNYRGTYLADVYSNKWMTGKAINSLGQVSCGHEIYFKTLS